MSQEDQWLGTEGSRKESNNGIRTKPLRQSLETPYYYSLQQHTQPGGTAINIREARLTEPIEHSSHPSAERHKPAPSS